MKKWLKSFCFLISIVFIFPAFASNTSKTITIENYTKLPLLYLKVISSSNSSVELPSYIPAGTGTDFSIARGTITLSDETAATGLFQIGYDSQHYCTYTYIYNPSTNRPWFMYASDTNLDQISCPVDVDIHSIIVFQEMG